MVFLLRCKGGFHTAFQPVAASDVQSWLQSWVVEESARDPNGRRQDGGLGNSRSSHSSVSYTHLRAHETEADL
eukprot:968088-Amphidinium_carterae.1